MIAVNAPSSSARFLAAAIAPLLVAVIGCSTGADSGNDTPGGNNNATGGSGNGVGGGNSSGMGNVSGNATGGDGPVVAPNGARPVTLEGKPIYSRFLRLTNEQWENSVRYLLALDAPTGLSDTFQHPVAGTTEFDNNEKVVIVNGAIWSDFRNATEELVGKVSNDQALQKIVSTTDAATFIKTFGRRAFRRDLTTEELSEYQTMFTGAAAYSGSESAFVKGASLVMTAILQSPHFLYREELGDDGKPLSGYELASKLSLWIRNSIPSDAILDAAKSGAFDSLDSAVTQATQMLEDPLAKSSVQAFHASLYKLQLIDTITKDKVDGYDPALLPELNQSAIAFFDYLFTQNLGVKDLLTSNVAFVGSGLAKLYGVTAPGSGLQQVQLQGRSGWYSQIPFLTLWAVNNEPDSIHRGVRINLDTLCADPGAPLPNVPSVPALADNQTNRERYEALTGSCGATCHGQIINPIGFAFEGFDGLGRYRTVDQGKPVNTAATYPFIEGTKDFSGADQLMQLIAGGRQAHQCYAKKLASYALERDLVENERPVVESLADASLATGASFKQVMLALVKTDAFRTRVGGVQ